VGLDSQEGRAAVIGEYQIFFSFFQWVLVFFVSLWFSEPFPGFG
jgi:hypothetical protein